MDKKKLTIIAFYASPCQEAESYLLNKVLFGLHNNYEIFLIKPKFESLKFIFNLDKSFDNFLKDKIKIKEIDFNYYEILLIKIFRKLLIKIFYDSNHVDILNFFWKKKVLNYFKKLESIDGTILSWSNPLANHKVLLQIKKKIDNKWIAYFSDPIYENPYSSNKNFFLKKFDKYLEKKILSEANCIIVTSENYKNKLINIHPVKSEKINYIPHSFYNFNKLTKSIFNNINVDANYINLLHLGSLYGLRTPNSLINLLNKLGLFEINLRVYFIGFVEKKIIQSLKEYNKSLNSSIFFINSISYLNSLKLLNNFDVLINIDGLNDQGLFLPSKFIDYLSTDKPIFSITSINSEVDKISKQLGLECFHNNSSINKSNHELRSFFLNSKDYILNPISRGLRDNFSLNNQYLKFNKVI